MEELIKQYTNGEVTIVWKPAACIHSKICWNKVNGLPAVFNPFIKPWIKPEASTTERIVDQVKQCPSGALSYYYNNAAQEETQQDEEVRIEVLPNGPLLVYGNLTVKNSNGEETRRSKVTAFCRCGKSATKPYCDGSHIADGFQG